MDTPLIKKRQVSTSFFFFFKKNCRWTPHIRLKFLTMIFYYDRISVKEGIDTETYEQMISLLMKVFQKDVMAAMYFIILERIFTIMK